MIRGDDLKGGQTKMKAVLVDFHIGAANINNELH